jgi:hypothetical protein
MSENYLANWVQSLFSALGDEVSGETTDRSLVAAGMDCGRSKPVPLSL